MAGLSGAPEDEVVDRAGDAGGVGHRPQPDDRGDRRPLAARSDGRSHAEVPFSSARKWSAVAFADGGDGTGLPGSIALGAPTFLRPSLAVDEDGEPDRLVRARRRDGRSWPSSGLRVLLVATYPDAAALAGLRRRGRRRRSPAGMRALGLVAMADELRDEAGETLRAFTEAGVAVKVISGDDPETVVALARQAGLADDRRRSRAPSSTTLDDAALGVVASETTGLRPDHAGAEGAPRRRAARRRPLRGDDRRRRERRPVAQEGEPRDRDGQRQPGDPRRRRPRADGGLVRAPSPRPSRRASGSSTGCRTSSSCS